VQVHFLEYIQENATKASKYKRNVQHDFVSPEPHLIDCKKRSKSRHTGQHSSLVFANSALDLLKFIITKIQYPSLKITFLLTKTSTPVCHENLLHLGVSKNRGTQKWMVYNGKPYKNG